MNRYSGTSTHSAGVLTLKVYSMNMDSISANSMNWYSISILIGLELTISDATNFNVFVEHVLYFYFPREKLTFE